MTQTNEIELQRVSTDRRALEKYVELFSESFPGVTKYDLTYLAWQYCRNPNGAPLGFDALVGGRVVAHYVCIPMSMRVKGRPQRALLSLNTATHPAFQGKGLFTRLASATYDEARQLGFQFVYGVANSNSTPGFLKKLAFQLVEPLQAGFVLGRLPRLGNDETLDLAPNWDCDSLAWRLENPAGQYHRSHSNWIAAATGRAGIESYAIVSGAILSEVRTLRAASRFRLRLYLGTTGSMAWRGSWLAPIPKALRPSPLNLIYRAIGPDVPATIRQSRIGALEFDPY
jgi:GNAT superfamily N-acetyltransferase